MTVNKLKRLITEGKPAFGAQLRFGSPAIAELFGHVGFDWLAIDTEHAPQTSVGIQAQIQAIGNTDATPIVRLPRVDNEDMRLYLDMGARGFLAAFVNTQEDAELGAKSCRYPPVGIRGWGPHRAARYGMNAEEYTRTINDEVVFMPIIESAEAVRNLEDILSVNGVDSFVVGPVDLSISLGVPFEFGSSTYQDAEREILNTAKRVGKPAGNGIYNSPYDDAALRRTIESGFITLLVASDESLLQSGGGRIMEAIEKTGMR